jgi:hypothetical protein
VAASKTYSAGTAFITIVPSFLGIEEALQAGIKDAAAKADKNLAAQFDKGFKDTQNSAKTAGGKAGKSYAGSYQDEVTKTLEKSFKSLPEPQPGVDLKGWDKAVAEMRDKIKDLSKQKIGVDIDEKTFDESLAQMRKQLEALRKFPPENDPNLIGKLFNLDEAEQSLGDLQKFMTEAKRTALTGGDEVGAAFQTEMAKTIATAAGKIPPIKIDADSSAAETKLAEVRARLVELQSKHIGIDIDAGAALAELKAVQEILGKLDRKTVDINVRSTARDVSAGIVELTGNLDKATSATGGLGNGANFSASRLEYLIATGASLGTAIVPAAAAAAGAIGTVGTLAAGAAAGVGVFALAISGISDAVKALNQYSNDQKKSANSIDQANRQVASSTGQVAQAEASLANTRRTVADASADAARRVQAAERGVADARRDAATEQRDAIVAVKDARQAVQDANRDVADAQRENARDLADATRQVSAAQKTVTSAEQDALSVRKDLNAAIQQAIRDEEELTVSLAKNQADQEKAVADQMKALDDLNKLKTNPRATATELAQAQAAYDEQTAEILDLKQKHKELAQDKAKYDKQGVEGDDAVVAARKKIADADQAVADARDKLAREQDDRNETQIKNEERLSGAQERAAKAQEQAGKAVLAQRDTEIKSQEKIADAQRAVDDARRAQARQQADGQFQIQQAVNAVTAAQRSQQQAWEKTGTAGGDALDTLNQKLGALSPAGQTFARFIFGLKDDLASLRSAAAEPLLPQLQTAITMLLKYLPGVEAFVGKIAEKLGELSVRAVQSLGNPVFQRFFSYINATAVPSLETMFEVGENLTQGLVSLFLALTPFNNDVGSGLVKLSADFAHWAETFNKTQGYQDFLQYVRENGPRVVNLLGQLGELAIDLIKASAPLGSVVLRVISSLVTLINQIPTPVLTALVFAIGAVAVGFNLLGGAMRAIKFKEQITDIFGPKTSGLIQKYAIDTGRATDETGRFGKASATLAGLTSAASEKLTGFATGSGTAADKLGGLAKNAGAAAVSVGTKLKSGLSAAIGLLGGPWGLAITGASLAIGYFANKSDEQKKKVDTLRGALGDLADAYKAVTANGQQAGQAAADQFRDIVKNNPEMQKAVILLSQLGVSFDDMVKAAASGDPSAVIAKLNDEIQRTQVLQQQAEQRLAGTAAGRRVDDATAKAVTADKARIQSLTALRDAFVQNAGAIGQAAQADAILTANTERNQVVAMAQANIAKTGAAAQIDLVDAYDKNATAIDALNGLVSTFGNLQSTAQQRADAMKVAIQSQTGAAQDATEADETLSQKMITLTQTVNQAKAAHDKHSTSLALSSTTALHNRDALEDVASSIRDMYIQDIAAGKPLADVTKAHNARIAALKEEAKHLGLDKKATDALIKTYGGVPKNVSTIIKLDPNAFNTVYKNLQRMQFMQTMLKLGVDAGEAEKSWKVSQGQITKAIGHGLATGGPIVGPGTGTSDSIIAPIAGGGAVRVSNGEWVHKAAAVDYYGDAVMHAINNMQVPREQLVPRQRAAGGPVDRDEESPGFASGGKVKSQTWPFATNVSKTWVPSEAFVRAHTQIPTDDGSFTGLSADASVAKIQKFALAQRGKKYLWSAVGPNMYDCSGLVGNLWALATGHKLYRRYMSTGDMGPGRHGMVAGPGKKMTIYLGPGHTAANVGGLHAEAYGGNGTPLAIGRIGTRLSYYNQKLHLPGFAQGGPVDASALKNPQDRLISFLRFGWPEPPKGSGYDKLLSSPLAGQFDDGGFLPPGMSTVLNQTGAPEPVLTSRQWNDIGQLAKQAVAGRGGNTYNYEFRDTTLTPAYLRAQMDRDAIRARAGLPS